MKPGIIEGFYGKPWSWKARHDMLEFMHDHGFGSYIYAPKSDEHLRSRWQVNWKESVFNELLELSRQCKEKSLHFGIALSPVSLVDEWSARTADNLYSRLENIVLLDPDVFSVLFDDIKGDKSGLAEVQLEIVYQINKRFSFPEFLLCPTYYSNDPILEELFGPMPSNYLHDLGNDLPEHVNIFWTGDSVISSDYEQESLIEIAKVLKRKPVIWDNSIVNDGRKTSPYLPIQSVIEVSAFKTLTNGIYFNPMNASYLSQLCLKTCQLSGDEDNRLQNSLSSLCPEMAKDIINHLESFKSVGLDNLGEVEKTNLHAIFSDYKSPFSGDILSWLSGEFIFDPDCLT